MGLLDDLRRELARAMEQAQRAGEAGPPGPVAYPRKGSAGGQTAAPPRPAGGAAPALLPRPPARRLAIVACMDTRQQIERALSLKPGDAHILRNAGGIVTDDVLRSLVISHHMLGTREFFIINHTDCGMMTFTDDELRARIQQKMGTAASLDFQAFSDLEENVRRQIARVRSHPWIPADIPVRGFIYDLWTGRLREVAATDPLSDEAAPASARVGGRLRRERLERVAPGPPAIVREEPSGGDFRRKAAALAAGDPEAPGALSARDVSPPPEPAAPPPLTFAARDVLRALVLGEVLDEPKGRRARRPHPK